ncbi:MAG: AAA family ATPase, partial [Kiritimatiellae bacterium]|nr:AAA family ATPase [Kiritimatiellia bacterium]
MYLKSLDMVGFKSFAEITSLHFQPGMTAIVGPNGCGKSNVADAVRWVLGEQSPKAMRATKMEDCIFNGTDNKKPLGMAEVNITFADCEQALGIEYHEVTITRRVFRSGEGQYFLNKMPCRLKDIQRLFLGTGVGTTSYSLMEQGQIDKVLSSHPEDRRTIFEEASGITKFKADKKEAIRKLEYTEANLLRLADVIREVKRQIGSLQRQAGKARRYKELRDELRKYDVHVSKHKLGMMDTDIQRYQSEIASYNKQIQACRDEVSEMEQGNSVLRKSVLQSEHEIGTIMEK